MSAGVGGACVARDALVAWLDALLDVGAWRDKSMNGLQVEGADRVTKVATAVDGALATFAMAEEAGAEFLIVHHGLFWGAVEPVRGPLRDRLAALLDAGISLYAAHLPLDAHPELGNNAVLADLLDLEEREPFGTWDGTPIGVMGRLADPAGREDLAGRLEALLGARPDVLPFGSDRIERIAVVSGAAASLVGEAATKGLDALVTGESSHTAWHAAREHGVNLVFAGHYATETVGVRALGDRIADTFGVEAVFLDAPTGY